MFFAPLTYDATGGYKAVPTFTTTVDPTNPANYQLYQFNIAPKNSKDWNFYGRADVAHDLSGFLSKVAVGGEYQFRKRDYSRRDFIVNPTAGTPLTSLGTGAYQQLPFDDYLAGLGGNIPRQFLVPVTSAYLNAFFTPTVRNSALTAADLAASFRTTEKIASVYARADYTFDVGGVAITGNIGARYVHTDQVASGNLRSGSTTTPVSFPRRSTTCCPASTCARNSRAASSAAQCQPRADLPQRDRQRPAHHGLDRRAHRQRRQPGAGAVPGNAVRRLAGMVFQPHRLAERRSVLQGAGQLHHPAERADRHSGRGTVQLSTQVNGGNAKVYGLEAAYHQVFTSCPSRSMASASRPRTRARLWRRATPPVRARSPTN
jgi:hypothetical protein